MFGALVLAAFLLGSYRISELFMRIIEPWPQWTVFVAFPVLGMTLGLWGGMLGFLELAYG